jgi:GNAT superfamily N-acetyltransferase
MSAPLVRRAVAADCEAIHAMLKGLAAYEHVPDAVGATPDSLRRDGFGAQPQFAALIAEHDGRPVGFLLWTWNYSTWQGRRGFFIEDIFVDDSARRLGVGRAMMAELARIALAEGCGRIDLNVLTWNPARRFYAALGMKHIDDWAPYRIENQALRDLAGHAAQPR